MTTENIYFNSNIINVNEEYKEAKFNQIFDSPLLQAPASDYLFAVSRFEISRATFPIFIFKNNTYIISLEYAGFTTISNTLSLTNLNELPNSPQTKYSVQPEFENYIYNIDQFLQCVNYWLSITFTALKVAVPAIVSVLPPQIFFNDSAQLFYLRIPKTYITSDSSNIRIYMNNSLFNYFEGIPAILINRFLPNNTNYRLIYYETTNNYWPISYDNSGAYLQMNQSSSSIPYWFDFKKLIFKTNMPIISEFFNINGIASLNIEQVLIDFDLVFTNLDEYRQPITFSSDLFRFYNFNTNNSINEWNFKLVLRDRFGQESPYILFLGDFISMKFLFQKQLY